MNRKTEPVKTSRRYDATGRQEQARARREAVLDSALRQYLDKGFGSTTIASIAAEAGVSPDTIFKSFGGKTGLVKAILQRSLEGAGPVPAEHRSDELKLTETDPRKITQGWGVLTAEVAPRGAPLMLLLDAAAHTDPEMAELRAEFDRGRLVRMRHNAAALFERGFLRSDLTVEKAAQICWTYSSPELYRLLVVDQGWSLEEYGRFIGDALTAALLPSVEL